MGEATKIEWTATPLPDGTTLPGFTFNAWIGCEKVSPGCKHCYAEVDTYARVSKSRGLPLWGPGSSRHVTSASNWRKPIAWNREAERSGIRRRVFCSSLSDVFEDRPNPRPGYAYDDVLRKARADLWALIHETPWLDWLLLTKRPENAERLAVQAWADAFAYSTAGGEPESWWLPNIWLGTTCEDQKHANERIPHLVAAGATVKFVSYEPALEQVDFTTWLRVQVASDPGPHFVSEIDWVIVGGESGSRERSRPFDLAWARSAITQCKAAGTACFMKQLGALAIDTDYRAGVHAEHDKRSQRAMRELGMDHVGFHLVATHHPKGGDIAEWPEDLRVRQWPEVRS